MGALGRRTGAAGAGAGGGGSSGASSISPGLDFEEGRVLGGMGLPPSLSGDACNLWEGALGEVGAG